MFDNNSMEERCEQTNSSSTIRSSESEPTPDECSANQPATELDSHAHGYDSQTSHTNRPTESYSTNNFVDKQLDSHLNGSHQTNQSFAEESKKPSEGYTSNQNESSTESSSLDQPAVKMTPEISAMPNESTADELKVNPPVAESAIKNSTTHNDTI